MQVQEAVLVDIPSMLQPLEHRNRMPTGAIGGTEHACRIYAGLNKTPTRAPPTKPASLPARFGMYERAGKPCPSADKRIEHIRMPAPSTEIVQAPYKPGLHGGGHQHAAGGRQGGTRRPCGSRSRNLSASIGPKESATTAKHDVNISGTWCSGTIRDRGDGSCICFPLGKTGWRRGANRKMLR